MELEDSRTNKSEVKRLESILSRLQQEMSTSQEQMSHSKAELSQERAITASLTKRTEVSISKSCSCVLLCTM